VLKDDAAKGNSEKFGNKIAKCRYLFCIDSGFFGLEDKWNVNVYSGERTFDGFILHDIGNTLPIIHGINFDCKFCSFHVIGKDSDITLFLVI
jgi:hypothetical protein